MLILHSVKINEECESQDPNQENRGSLDVVRPVKIIQSKQAKSRRPHKEQWIFKALNNKQIENGKRKACRNKNEESNVE
ncbi:MAG: hypothetical protein QM215_04085, partial [Bacillota bacterium]|nr:hypothetical protein [Bacillota bacterium]